MMSISWIESKNNSSFIVDYLCLNKNAALYTNVKTEIAITTVFEKFQSKIIGFVGKITIDPFSYQGFFNGLTDSWAKSS